jgi:hypothetical protein
MILNFHFLLQKVILTIETTIGSLKVEFSFTSLTVSVTSTTAPNVNKNGPKYSVKNTYIYMEEF